MLPTILQGAPSSSMVEPTLKSLEDMVPAQTTRPRAWRGAAEARRCWRGGLRTWCFGFERFLELVKFGNVGG